MAHVTVRPEREVVIVAALADPVAHADVRPLAARLRVLARSASTMELER